MGGSLLNLPFQDLVSPGTRHDDYATLLAAPDLDPNIWRGASPEEGALLLLTPDRATALEEDGTVAARVAGRREVELERGRRAVPLTLLHLSPSGR